MKRRYIALLLTLITTVAMAQPKAFSKQEKNDFLDADSYYVYGDYNTAYQLFSKVEGVDPQFLELDFKMGYTLMQLKKYDEAIPYFKKSIAYDIEALYYLAEIYLRDANLEKASEYIKQYEEKWNDEEVLHSMADISFLKSQLKVARTLMDDPVNIKLNNVGSKINTAADEYVPLIDGDESQMIFTTKRLSANNGENADGVPYENVYVSYKGEDGEWLEAKAIEGKINTPSNDACVGLSTDGYTLFIFRPNENQFAGDIYKSEYRKNGWSEPILMDDHINSYLSIEASATISLDGNRIYFSSNRAGGYGGFDLYRVVKLPNGKWSYPKNLGPTINTSKNEDAPFLDADGKTLYFSSQAHENMGGYDVFQSVWNETEGWSTPENLGYPINTTKDDIHYVIAANEKHAYYSSVKKGGFGGQDIYQIDYLERRLRQSIIRAEVKDSEGMAIASDISLIDTNNGDLIGIYKSSPKDGSFIFLVNPEVEYDLIVEYGEGEEHLETIKYTKNELLDPPFKSIKL